VACGRSTTDVVREGHEPSQSPAPAGADASPSVFPFVCSPGLPCSILWSFSLRGSDLDGGGALLADIGIGGYCLSAGNVCSVWRLTFR
jgi:hypothetical protein